MKNKKNLELWRVTVRWKSWLGVANSTTLLITTPTLSIKRAIEKALPVIKRNRADWRGAQIRQIEYVGDIDA